MLRSAILAAISATTLFAAPASAAKILYTISGQFTGDLGGPFNVPATFKALGDTNNLTFTADGSRNVELSSFTATAPTGLFVFQAPSIRFGTNNGYAGIIVNVDGNNPFVFTSSALAGYDAVSEVAPIAVNYYGSFGGPFQTDRGDVTFSGASDLVFSASFVPEPAEWALMFAGFGLIGAAMRRRTGAKVVYA